MSILTLCISAYYSGILVLSSGQANYVFLLIIWNQPIEESIWKHIWEYALYRVNLTILNINIFKNMSYLFQSLITFILYKIAKFLTSHFLQASQSPLRTLFKFPIPNPRWRRVIRKDHLASQIIVLNFTELIFYCCYTSSWFIGCLINAK